MEEWRLLCAAAVAAVWAMPWPIRPRPIMPTLSKDAEVGRVEENWRRAKATLEAVFLDTTWWNTLDIIILFAASNLCRV